MLLYLRFYFFSLKFLYICILEIRVYYILLLLEDDQPKKGRNIISKIDYELLLSCQVIYYDTILPNYELSLANYVMTLTKLLRRFA
jgi:hypothetical protein